MTPWVVALLVVLVFTGMGVLAWLFTTAALEVSIQQGLEAAQEPDPEDRDAA